MSLLFGNLTEDFIVFQQTVAMADTGDATAIADLPNAASHFRHTAANDASYLVYIGMFNLHIF